MTPKNKMDDYQHTFKEEFSFTCFCVFVGCVVLGLFLLLTKLNIGLSMFEASEGYLSFVDKVLTILGIFLILFKATGSYFIFKDYDERSFGTFFVMVLTTAAVGFAWFYAVAYFWA